ncbi:SMEK domain-containing protein [Arcicella sp. LKC2W]|uniref:SMEK domain-containing protein n=1 Tax=Arcicella sp. LKC2W TaxID=2984198 RepID=UPI002B1F65C7|nr:SMEK domain-containing protein [Arcicella sp. LKC2W]MEA5458211.1 SMEK domain-containing protein [Arcicella sp. LKC2W]
MTRGILIGEIIDNLSNLNNQITFRCSLGFTDLNKVSEDFFAKLLNQIYSYNLVNLNVTRSNEPGLDIGDEINAVAYQVTSQADSSKINDTLGKITEKQGEKFRQIKILIIGEKQKSYTAIKSDLITKFQYTKSEKSEPENFIDFNIVDTKDLLRDMITLDFKQIHKIYEFIKNEIQNVIIELEIPRTDGTYPTSLLTYREIRPETKAINARKILDNSDFSSLTLNKINTYFDELASVTRITREIYYFIIDEGEFQDDTFSIYYDEAIRKINIPNKRLEQEINILSRRKLIFDIDEEEPILTLKVNEEIGLMLSEMKTNMDLNKIIVNLDFTKLDNYLADPDLQSGSSG